MYGQTESIIFAIVAASGIACFTDIFRGKIFNWLTLPALLLGVIFSWGFNGTEGLEYSLLGLLSGLLYFGWMFFLGVMGGGDVKLLMALGAWGGPRLTEEIAVLSVILGGLFALISLIASGRLISFADKFYRFVLSISVKELEVSFPKADPRLKMPFGVPMAIAAIWSLLAHPIVRWGIPVWPR